MAGAQTIADYSRAQRTWLENAMAQAAARSAGLGASAPAAAAASAPVAPPPAVARMPLPAWSPAVQVSGVFTLRGGAVAEVVVDTTAYLLGAGQGVPGTGWRVDTVAIDRVVLSRHGDVAGADDPGARKVFALPALR